ncbi:glutathione S-transferase [Pisolithus sp. B1]|nr:glutathione S-transferase [Pisolithus sp. B1]
MAIGKLYSVSGVGQTTVLRASCVAPYSNPIFASQIQVTAAVAGVELEEPDSRSRGTDSFNLTEGAAIAQYSTYHSRIRDASEIVRWKEEKYMDGYPWERWLQATFSCFGCSTLSGLLGDTIEGTALVDQYVRFAETEIQALSSVYYMLLNGYIPYNKAIHAALVEGQLRGSNTLEAILLTRTYLVDERLTLGDIAVASVIFLSVSYILDAPLRNGYPNVLRHLDLIIDQPKLKDVFGQPTFVEKAAQYTPPAKEKKEKEPKQPVLAPAPKKEKHEKVEVDENLVPEEPKPKYPLHLPPKSTFNLEDWKRAYSNKDTCRSGGSLERFYEK